MFDIILEVTRGLILVFIIGFLLRADKDVVRGRDGWLYFKLGFLCLLFGSVMDITDNFESLSHTVVIGDTPVQAFLEKFVGYLGGFALIAVGLWKWLPSFHEEPNSGGSKA